MALITDIVTPHHRSRRRLLHLDGHEWRMTSSAVVADLGLEIGHVEPDGDLADRIARAEVTHARERALRLLGYRERSVKELASRLEQDGYPHDTAVDTVDSLRASGIVDDARFARALAHSMTSVRGLGRTRLAAELRSKGVDDELVDAVLEESCSPDNEMARATELARALAARTGPDVGRLATRLVRKGYTRSTALRAAKAAVPAGPSGEPDLWEGEGAG